MPVIKELFAFIIADKDDKDEGVPGISTPDGMMPLMGADIERAKSLKGIAQTLANESGKSITLAKFSVREDIEVLQPALGEARKHKDQTCPVCSTLLNAASGFNNNASPSPGDVSICIRCGAVLKFDEQMTLQQVPEAELQALDQDDRRLLFEARSAVRDLRTKIGGVIDGPDSTH